MARGEMTLKDEGRIHAAVAAAEAAAGVELCVVVVPAAGNDPGRVADAMFTDLNLGAGPRLLIVVCSDARAVEVRRSAAAASLVTDEQCATMVAEMRIRFVRDAIAEGIEAGMAVLTGADADATPAA